MARDGFAYTAFAQAANGITAELVYCVPLEAVDKICNQTLRNTGQTARKLSVTAHAECVLGMGLGAAAPFAINRRDPATSAILAQNTDDTAFPRRIPLPTLAEAPAMSRRTKPNSSELAARLREV